MSRLPSPLIKDHDRLSYGLSNTNLQANTSEAKNTRRASVSTRSRGVRSTGGGADPGGDCGCGPGWSTALLLRATVCSACAIAVRQRRTYPAATRMMRPGKAARLNNSVRNQRMLPGTAWDVDESLWAPMAPSALRCRARADLDGRDCNSMGCWCGRHVGAGAGGECLLDRGDCGVRGAIWCLGARCDGEVGGSDAAGFEGHIGSKVEGVFNARLSAWFANGSWDCK